MNDVYKMYMLVWCFINHDKSIFKKAVLYINSFITMANTLHQRMVCPGNFKNVIVSFFSLSA